MKLTNWGEMDFEGWMWPQAIKMVFLGRLWLGLKSQVEKVVVNILGVLRRVNPREHGVGQSLWICLPTGIISLPNCFFRFQV